MLLGDLGVDDEILRVGRDVFELGNLVGLFEVTLLRVLAFNAAGAPSTGSIESIARATIS